MALTPFQFNIQQGNPIAAYQAGAQVAANQQRNRMAQLQEARAQRAEQAQMQRVSREDQANALRQAAAAYQLAGQQEDPAQRDAIIAGYRQNMERIYGPESVADFSPRFEQSEYDALRAFMPAAAKPDATEQKIALAERRLGRPLNEAEILQVTGAAPRQPLVQNIVGGGGSLEARALTPADIEALDITPEQAEGLIIQDGKVVKRPETAGEAEARATRTRGAKVVETLRPVQAALSRYKTLLDQTGAEVQGAIGQGAELQAAYRDAQLALKEAANLGVLSGPDLALLESVLTPPVGVGAKIGEMWARMTTDPNDRATYAATLDRQLEAVNQRIAEAQGAQTVPAPDEPGPTREPVPGDLPYPQTLAEYEAIPSGARYQHPDDPPGTYRTKR